MPRKEEETPTPEDGGELEEVKGKKVPREKYEEALKEILKAKADADNWKNEYYKAYADTQNLRKALEEEKRVAIRYRAEGFVDNLIPALDAFHVALATPASNQEVANYLVGFQYIYAQFRSALESDGVSEIEPSRGTDFDPNSMHAVDSVECEDLPPNKVVSVTAKGWKLHDRLIRPAMVTVSKKKEESKPDQQEEKQESPANAA